MTERAALFPDLAAPVAEPDAAAERYFYEYRFTRHAIGERARCDMPDLAHEAVAPLFAGAESERLVVVALDRKQRTLAAETLYVGNVAGCSVRMAEVFRLAVRVNASGLILAHNHPSGDPTPSADDLRSTRDARAAGRLLGVEVIDHLILGDEGGRWVSLRRSEPSVWERG